MEKIIKYSVLKYCPLNKYSRFDAPLTGVTLGIIFHEEKTGYREFRHTQDYAVLSKMEPDIDAIITEKLLTGIKAEVEKPVSHTFEIEEFTKFYLNDFRFTPPQKEKYDDLMGTIQQIYQRLASTTHHLAD